VGVAETSPCKQSHPLSHGHVSRCSRDRRPQDQMKKRVTHNKDPDSKRQRPQSGENPPSTPTELKGSSDTGPKAENLNPESQRLQGADINAPPASLSGNQRLFSPQQKGMIVEPVPRLQSALLALFIAVIALDACPAFFRTLDRAKSAIDPLVDVTGLCRAAGSCSPPMSTKLIRGCRLKFCSLTARRCAGIRRTGPSLPRSIGS